jgi:hypothetical protein
MVDPSLACLMVAVEVLEIVVEIDRSRTEVTAEESGMGGEHGRNVDVAFAAKGDRYSDLPFVKVGDYCRFLVARCVLWGGLDSIERKLNNTHLSEEPCDEITKDDRLVGFVVAWGRRNTSQVPQVPFPFIESTVRGAGIE